MMKTENENTWRQLERESKRLDILMAVVFGFLGLVSVAMTAAVFVDAIFNVF